MPVAAHAEWKARAKERETAGTRAAEEQARQLEQQRKTLGVGDYEERSATVKDRLTDAQLGILINGAQNPARLIYALGRSPPSSTSWPARITLPASPSCWVASKRTSR
jgi:hypothetical protein